MFVGYENEIRSKMINEWGKKNNPQYICLNPSYRRSSTNRHIYVLIKNLVSGETKEVKFSNLKKINPFSRGKDRNYMVQQQINQIGLKQKYAYRCTDPSVKIKGKNKRYVKIQCLSTKKEVVVLHHSLLEGKNPFNQDINREEVLQVQPMYEKLFKQLKISYQKEYRLGKGSIIDFKIKLPNKNKYDLVEVKKSSRLCTSNNQIQRYIKLSSKQSDQFDRIYFSDPQGKHKNKGFISILELKRALINEMNNFKG